MSEPNWVALGSRGGVVDWEGGWSAGVAYQPGDVVRHNGIDYIAVNPSTGQQPTLAASTDAPGRELAYAESVAVINTNAITEATATALVTLPAVTLDGSTPVMLDCWFAAIVGTGLSLAFFDGETSLGGDIGMGPTNLPGFSMRRRYTPTAGSHTFSVRFWVSSGTGTVYNGPGTVGAQAPGFIRITKVVL